MQQLKKLIWIGFLLLFLKLNIQTNDWFCADVVSQIIEAILCACLNDHLLRVTWKPMQFIVKVLNELKNRKFISN